jgi:tRNA-Thr(GGU) m(6)t(6)A37 methyltransferase TsaA
VSGTISLTPVGFVRGGRTEPIDDDWDSVDAAIELDGSRFGDEVVAGLDEFSHLDVVFVFDRVADDDVHLGARRPRGRADWPEVGIFAQRAKARPNRIGVSTCRLLGVDGLTLRVRGLDAIDGSPVLDVKPHVEEMGPREAVSEPSWMRELMQGYWHSDGAPSA